MNLMRLSAIVLLICSLSLTQQTQASTPPLPKRPRIGLVLSGGGARGAAHIGVLKVLEELHIPIDCIAGTSGGALVGGLYASGMSPEEIEQTVRKIDWEKLFDDAPSRKNLSYRRKMDNGKYIPNLEFGLKDGKIMMPTGLTVGRKISFLLHRLMLRNGAVTDFDNLRIPFRAVATDLATGQMVVLSKGSLADALRASMSVPGAIAPMEINGELLADGGLVRNLPVDVIKSMGADVIIAVNVAKTLFPRERLNSALAVSQQMITIMLLKDEKQQLSLLKPGDVYIKPDLGDMAASDFAHLPDAIKPGQVVAEQYRNALSRLSVSDAAYAAFLQHQRGVNVQNQVVDFVNVSDNSKLDPKVLLSRIRTRPGEKLKVKTLQRDLDRIYQIGSFESVSFEWVQDSDRSGILINTQNKPWGNNFFQLGIKFSDDLEGDTRFGLLVAHTMTEVNRLGGEWKNEFQFGRTQKFHSEFFQPLDYAGQWAVMPYAEYSSEIKERYSQSHVWSEYRLRLLTGGLFFGRQFSNWGAAMIGVVSKTGSAAPFDVFEESSTGEKTDVDIGGYMFRFDYDQLDDPYFPRSGHSGRLHWFKSDKSFGANVSYYKLDIALENVFSLGQNSTVILAGEYGDSLGTTLPFYDNFTLGGILNMSGYRPGQLYGNYKLFLRSVYYQQLPLRLFGFKFYAGGSLEAGNVWMEKSSMSFSTLNYSGSFFLGSRTMAGAIFIGYGRADDGNNLFYVSIGQTF